MTTASFPSVWLHTIAAILVIAICSPPIAQAQDGQARFEAADNAMNQVYQTLTRSTDPRAIAPLRKSQQIWIKFRDANAALAATVKAGNQEVAIGQKALDTEWRVDFLNEYFVRRNRSAGDIGNGALVTVDRQLNEEYRAALAGQSGAVSEALRISQRAWIATKEADLSTLQSAGAIKATNEIWAFVRGRTEQRLAALRSVRAASSKVEGPPSASIPLPAEPAASALPPIMIGQRLRSESVSRPTLTPAAPAAHPDQVITQIDAGSPYSDSLVLDMRENLLVGLTGSAIDFWDVQTGALIRSIAVEDPGEGISSQGESLVNVGGGQVAVLASVGRMPDEIYFYGRDSDLRLSSIDRTLRFSRFDVLPSVSREGGKFALLSWREPFLISRLSGRQELLVGAVGGDLRKFTVPAEPNQEWTFFALAMDGNSVAVASEVRVLIISLPDGKVVNDSPVQPGVKVIAMIPDSRSAGFIVGAASGELLRVVPGDRSFKNAGRLPFKAGPKQRFENIGITKPGWVSARVSHDNAKPETVVSDDAPQTVRDFLTALQSRLPSSETVSITFDWEGQFAAVSRLSGSVELYHLASGIKVRSFGTPNPERIVKLSGDGRTLVTYRRSSAEALEVNTFAIDQFRQRHFVVEGFDDVLGIDESASHLLAYRHQQHAPPLDQSSPWSELSSDSRRAPIGIVDLQTGKITRPILPGKARDWHFCPEANLLIRLGGERDGNEAVLFDPFGPAGGEVRRINLKQLGSSESQVHSASISVSPDRRKLCLVNTRLDCLVVADITSAAGPKLTQSYSLEPNDPASPDFRGVSTSFSHDSNLIAIVRSRMRTDSVELVDTRKSGRVVEAGEFEMVGGAFDGGPAFSSDGQRILISERHRFGAGIRLNLVDATSGRKVTSLTIEGGRGQVAQSGARALVESGGVGHHLIDVKGDTLVETARFVAGTGDSYALVLPDGCYLATGDTHRLISFASGGRSQPAESLDIRYNRPDIVAQALGAAPELVQAFRRGYEKRLARLGISEKDLAKGAQPPRVTIDYNKTPLTTAERILHLPMDVKPGAAPLAALEVTVNDIPILGRTGRSLSEMQTHGFSETEEIELASGSNKVTVWARDANGLTSSRASINVTLTAKPPKPPTLYVLAVGINEYGGVLSTLNFARKDAADIVDVFEKSARPTFADVKPMLLRDPEATRRGILDARAFLATAAVDDQVVIFMSGHGALDTDYEYRFCATDIDPGRLSETTLTFGEIESLLDDCRARKRIVMLDTCHAGEPDRDDPSLSKVTLLTKARPNSISFQPFAAKGGGITAPRMTDLLQDYFVDLRIGAGAAVLSSSTAAQSSIETEEVKNGFFTSAVIKGLRERKANPKADLKADLDGNGTVSISELLRYCQEEVRELSNGVQEPVSRHVNLADDFSVVKYR